MRGREKDGIQIRYSKTAESFLTVKSSVANKNKDERHNAADNQIPGVQFAEEPQNLPPTGTVRLTDGNLP